MADVIVVGGGASGLAAAIAAASCDASVLVLETGERVGSKILATGNGRCNLTNMRAAPGVYNAPDFVASALDRVTPKGVRAWFKQLGLITLEEREGRVYPLSNTANSVLDVLRLACSRLGVELRCGQKAELIEKVAGRLHVVTDGGEVFEARRVVAACGGGSRLLGSAGHTLALFEPVLCSLATETDRLRGLSGVRVHAKVHLYEKPGDRFSIAAEEGEVLFRDYGLSGICIFNMSRHARAGMELGLDLLAHMGSSAVLAMLEERIEMLGAPSNEGLLCGVFHPAVIRALLREARLRPSDAAAKADMERLCRCIKGYRLEVKGPGDVRHAQLTRGGAALDEFDPETLASRKLEGLFACGEALDVDGPCGGYNLQWAWASGLTAGASAALSPS